jgi:hypothetical protein
LMSSSHVISERYDIFPFLVFPWVFRYVRKENGFRWKVVFFNLFVS